eukprot:45041-Amorphochlora_amoeboformis.AAC.1
MCELIRRSPEMSLSETYGDPRESRLVILLRPVGPTWGFCHLLCPMSSRYSGIRTRSGAKFVSVRPNKRLKIKGAKSSRDSKSERARLLSDETERKVLPKFGAIGIRTRRAPRKAIVNRKVEILEPAGSAPKRKGKGRKTKKGFSEKQPIMATGRSTRSKVSKPLDINLFDLDTPNPRKIKKKLEKKKVGKKKKAKRGRLWNFLPCDGILITGMFPRRKAVEESDDEVAPPPPKRRKRLKISGILENIEDHASREWSVEEIRALLYGVNEYGEGQWSKILGGFQRVLINRTPTDLRMKYRNLVEQQSRDEKRAKLIKKGKPKPRRRV